MSAKEIVELKKNIELLNKRLHEFSYDLSRWKIEFTVELDQKTLDIKVSAIKPFGGGGVIKTIPKSTALYYIGNTDTLVEDIVDEIFNVLIKNQMKNELTRKLATVVQNISVMESKK